MPSQRQQRLDSKQLLQTRRDSLDFRDHIYMPTLVPLASELLPDPKCLHVRNQQAEGACTGFGLAAVANFLLQQRRVVPDSTQVSPRMLYEMARRYDEWPGEAYSGSSARGAMKGWHKHGVCAHTLWP